jgi:predicted amidohydrolase YtcJ
MERVLLKNGFIWATEESNRFITELKIEDGRIVEEFKSPKNVVSVDLKGRYVLPAFRDGHCHPLFAGREQSNFYVSGAQTLDELRDLLKKFHLENPKIGWIDASAYDPTHFKVKTAKLLDRAVQDVPVVLHSVDHHALWVNSAALAAAGIAKPVKQPSGGVIETDASGNATGILREWPAMRLVLDLIPPRSMSQELGILESAQNQLLEYGIVAVQDAWIEPDMAEVYLRAATKQRLKIRTDLAFKLSPEDWESSLAAAVGYRTKIDKLDSDQLSANSVKLFIDGVISNNTASLLPESCLKPNKHLEIWPDSTLADALHAAASSGFQLHLHCIGDAAVRRALDAIQALIETGVEMKLRPVIVHLEILAKAEIARLAELNVFANLQPLWAKYDEMAQSSLKKLTHGSSARMYPIRSLLDSGAEVSFGSDWPVTSPNPLEGIRVAVTRAKGSERGLNPSEAITLAQSWRAYSKTVANQMGASDEGSLEVGQQADFVVLNRNPFTLNRRNFDELQVEQTWIAGTQVSGDRD